VLNFSKAVVEWWAEPNQATGPDQSEFTGLFKNMATSLASDFTRNVKYAEANSSWKL